MKRQLFYFQYGFRYSPEQIQRMCKIVQGFDKLKSLDTRCQTIFMVYYRNQQISVLNNVLVSYADKDFVEIQNNISGLPLTAKEKEELGLIKDESRKYFYYSTIISVVLAVAPFVGPKAYEYGKNFISETNFVQEYQEQHQTEQLPKKTNYPYNGIIISQRRPSKVKIWRACNQSNSRKITDKYLNIFSFAYAPIPLNQIVEVSSIDIAVFSHYQLFVNNLLKFSFVRSRASTFTL